MSNPHLPQIYRQALFNDPCVYCGGEPTGLDHIRPRSSYRAVPNSRQYRKWLTSWENLAPACARCDSAKAATPLLLFLVQLQQRGFPKLRAKSVRRFARMLAMRRKLWRRYQRSVQRDSERRNQHEQQTR